MSTEAVHDTFENDPELLAEIVVESREHLSSVEEHLLVLEKDVGNADALNAIFRGFHTIKGLCGFLGLDGIRAVTHELETLLDSARNSKLVVTPEVADVILHGVDYVNRGLNALEAGHRNAPQLQADPALLDSIHRVLEAKPLAPAEPQAVEAAALPSTETRLIKVDTQKLDTLFEVVGELIIAQSMVRNDLNSRADRDLGLQRNLSLLHRLIGELQRITMSMRTTPIAQLFQKTVRVARDVARKSGKQVEVELAGEDTELDRNIVEELADPFLHLVRNAIDHGVEPADERVAAGKHPAGRLSLRSAQEAGLIVIEISDDGRGLDKARIRQKALAQGLLGSDQEVTDEDLVNFIFVPGFSTAVKATEVSGRGVGMDVVRSRVEKLRGRVDVRSAEGAGTTFTIKLPLTLAVIDGLVVRVASERYVIPTIVVSEVFRPKADALVTAAGCGEMVKLRDRVLPILRLADAFGISAARRAASDAVLIRIKSDGREVCLMVDDLLCRQEVVIKSLGELFRNAPAVCGGTILGDGRVGLILDTDHLCERTRHVPGCSAV